MYFAPDGIRGSLMHPAFSVIFLTTLIGAGQGLFLALYTGQVYSVFGVLPDQDSARLYALGSLLALFLLALGLLAERWFFFAQANHPQNLYYQTV